MINKIKKSFPHQIDLLVRNYFFIFLKLRLQRGRNSKYYETSCQIDQFRIKLIKFNKSIIH